MSKPKKEKKSTKEPSLTINDDPNQFIQPRLNGRVLDVSHLTPEDLLRVLGRSGLTNEEIAAVFGLNVDQFAYTLENNETLRDILEEAKKVPDKAVEAALYKRALGYETREIHKVHGKPTKIILKSIAPDVIADIFWLKNRDPKRWRDTLTVQHTLRDQLDRAHRAMRSGLGPKALPNGGGSGGEIEDAEEVGEA